MSYSVSIRRADRSPLGDLETVERAISAAFPGVQFYGEPSGAEKIEVMRARGVEFPDVLRQFLEQEPATRQGDFDSDFANGGFFVRFFLGANAEVHTLLVELRGETERAGPFLELLSTQTGWVVDEHE